MQRRTIFLSVFAISLASIAWAAEKPGADPHEAEIGKTVSALEEAFNRGDAKALAACWTSDGEFIGPRGQRIVGHEQIEAAFRDFLAAHPNSKLRLGVASLRLLADNVALADLLTEMTPMPEGVESEPISTMVLVKHDGHWLIGSMHEAQSSESSHYFCLKDLKWMVGDWVADAANESDVSTRSSCDWTANGSYLIRKFATDWKQGTLVAGTEVIGWDPRAHRIRSWTFDSDGSFGESVWTRDGDCWIVRYTGVLADGGDVSVTHVVTLVDADHLTVQSKDRLRNGEKQPDLPEFKLKRGPAPQAAKPKPGVKLDRVLP